MIACCCAGLSMAFAEPHLCPHDSTVEVSRRSDAESVKLKFVNDAGIDVSLFWVNFEGEEVLVCLSVLLYYYLYRTGSSFLQICKTIFCGSCDVLHSRILVLFFCYVHLCMFAFPSTTTSHLQAHT